jgi:endonuclease/exonuclease/phosphatase (EEP) superfamily protein YafD
MRAWRGAQDELSGWATRTTGPLVVAGDFNASVDHPGMRQLLATGLRDAHEVAGAGRPVTWPNGRMLPPFVQLDHVLVRGLDVESADDVRVPGSDHDAVIAHLVVPRT